tara:strand:+ start:772 stop:1197 length:426 start_codon:yes stop_codon:yes gene_type:complete
MNSAIISRIENALTEQLNSAIEDIVMSVMESELECHDFDTQYDTYTGVQSDYAADISELAENIGESIRVQMENRVHHMQIVVFNRYADEVLPHIQAAHEQDGEVDIPARRESWSNFIDSLNKNDEICDYVAANIDADVDSL